MHLVAAGRWRSRSYLQVCDEGQSLPGERLTALPLTVPAVRVLPAVLRGGVVKDLRRRLEPPDGHKHSQQRLDGRSDGGFAGGWTGLYRLQDCHRHLKFCPAFLLGSDDAGRWGLRLPVGAGWETGGGGGVTAD